MITHNPHRRAVNKRLTRDEVQRIAANIAKVPETLREETLRGVAAVFTRARHMNRGARRELPCRLGQVGRHPIPRHPCRPAQRPKEATNFP
jgi:hypothetical protein